MGVRSHTTNRVLDEKRDTGRDQLKAGRRMLNWLAEAREGTRGILRENHDQSESI
jgi:hypothetical protein